MLERALERPGGRTHPGLVHLYVPDGDVAVPRAGAAGRRRRSRSLVPDAGHLVHMPTHIDVLCGDYKHARVEPTRDRGQREVRRARGPRRVLRALPRARPPLRDLRGRCSSPVAGRAGRCGRPRGLAARGACCGSSSRRWPTTSRRSSHAPARAHPLRDVGGHPRAAAARRPRALLHHDGDDALRAASRTRRPGGRRKPRRRETRSAPPSRAYPTRATGALLPGARVAVDGGRHRSRRGPGLRPVDPALVLAPRERVEPARLPRVPRSAGEASEPARIVKGQPDVALARAVPIRSSMLLPHDAARGGPLGVDPEDVGDPHLSAALTRRPGSCPTRAPRSS